MRKTAGLVVLCGWALVSGASNASASDPNGTKTTIIDLGGNCDVYTITVFPWHQAGTYDNSCDGVDAIGSGMEGKVTGVSPKDLTIGETYFGDPSSTYLLNIQYPLINGGGWSIFKSVDGANYSPLSSGTYTIVGADAVRSPRVGPPVHHSLRK